MGPNKAFQKLLSLVQPKKSGTKSIQRSKSVTRMNTGESITFAKISKKKTVSDDSVIVRQQIDDSFSQQNDDSVIVRQQIDDSIIVRQQIDDTVIVRQQIDDTVIVRQQIDDTVIVRQQIDDSISQQNDDEIPIIRREIDDYCAHKINIQQFILPELIIQEHTIEESVDSVNITLSSVLQNVIDKTYLSINNTLEDSMQSHKPINDTVIFRLPKDEENCQQQQPILTQKQDTYSPKIVDTKQLVADFVEHIKKTTKQAVIVKYDKSNNKQYEGQINGNQCHGLGIGYYGNKMYIGEWKNGKRNGKGNWYVDDYLKYEGEWENGKKHGRGIWYYISKQIKYQGQFQDDDINGQGTTFYENGRMEFNGIFKNTKGYTGTKYRYVGDKIEEIKYVNGVLDQKK